MWVRGRPHVQRHAQVVVSLVDGNAIRSNDVAAEQGILDVAQQGARLLDDGRTLSPPAAGRPSQECGCSPHCELFLRVAAPSAPEANVQCMPAQGAALGDGVTLLYLLQVFQIASTDAHENYCCCSQRLAPRVPLLLERGWRQPAFGKRDL